MVCLLEQKALRALVVTVSLTAVGDGSILNIEGFEAAVLNTTLQPVVEGKILGKRRRRRPRMSFIMKSNRIYPCKFNSSYKEQQETDTSRVLSRCI